MLDYDERIRDNDMAHIVNLDERLTNINDSHIEYKKGDIMKKIFFVALLIALLIVVTGCQNPFKPNNNKVTGGLELTNNNVFVAPENLIEDYNKAMDDYTGRSTDPIALLGTQVVAGTNYMFLCTEDKEYKVVVVYNDLENNSSITKATTFDFKQYVDKNNDIDVEELVGGWTIEVPAKPIELSENVQAIFDKANENMVGATYYPISQVAHQNKDGKNYAILCFGRLSDQNSTTGVFLLTIKEDENGADTIVSISHVDLKKYNS